MENNPKEGELTPEEIKAEEEALKEVSEEDVRSGVIEDFGFDEEDDKERIDTAVAKELDKRKTVASITRQKAKWRDKANLPKETPVETEKPKESEETDSKQRKLIGEELEKRDLEAMDYPDELKEEISRIAEIQKVSVNKSVSDPYIQSKIEVWKKEKETEEASITRTNKAGTATQFNKDESPKVDMNTEEGRKKWDEYLDFLKEEEK